MADIWGILGKLILSILSNKTAGKDAISVQIPIDPPPVSPTPPGIDWTKITYNITPHFTVGEAISLHSWNRLANESDGLTDEVKANLIALCQKLEQVRTHLGCDLNIHCMLRSVQYNQEVLKSTPAADVHSFGQAVDFDCNKSMTIDQVQAKMEPVLESMEIRMEKNTPSWVHLDLRAPGPSGRYFTA